MTMMTEGRRACEWLRSEAEGTRSRDQVTVKIAGGAGMASGTVLGRDDRLAPLTRGREA